MNINEILKRSEARIKAKLIYPFAGMATCEAEAIIAHIRELEARAKKAERERNEAIKALSEQARLRGEAEGQLEASEMAGIVDGWKARAEAAEAKVARLHEAVHRSIVIFKRNFDRQNEMPPDLPALLSFALAAIQNLSAVPVILRDTLKAMEATDE